MVLCGAELVSTQALKEEGSLESCMPRFFFHITQGTRVRPANEGIDLPDDAAAWQEAITACSELISDLYPDLKAGTEWRMDVTDKTGAVRFRLRFSVDVDPKN